MRVSLRKHLVLPVSLLTAALAGCGGHATPTATPTPPISGNSNPGSQPSGVPANATTIPDIQKLTGWESCTACTGSAFARFSMNRGVTSPSLSGASAQFALLSGTHPFGGALWFNFLTSNAGATHLVLDLYFYEHNPSAPQALEFNVSQSTGGSRYDFATQCDLVNQRAWLVWSPTKGAWVSTDVPCVQPPPDTWNHLIWEFERNISGQAMFKAVTLNGNRSEVNMGMAHTKAGGTGIDFGFQLDANRTATPFPVWLDKINVTYW
jgi:hypothetical protein